MKKILTLLLLGGAIGQACLAQTSGNVGYGQAGGQDRAEQNERSKRLIAKEDMPPDRSSQFIDASVLMNIKADEYIAVFGISQEGANTAECLSKTDATIAAFTRELQKVGVAPNAITVDFATQNRIYGFDVVADVAKEKVAGFELKKNVSVHYTDQSLLDKLVLAASTAQVYDLVKVDYIVRNTQAIQDRLESEAARIVKQKAARNERLLGIRFIGPSQVYAERPSTYFPTNMYDSYTASESESVDSSFYRQKFTIQNARKSRTFFFNGLDASGFDYVINPVITEPVVQFTLYLKVRYDIDISRRAGQPKTVKAKNISAS